MATRSIILAWKISWTEEPGRLQSIGSHRVGHNWSDSASINVFAWKIPWTKDPGGLQSMGCKELDMMSDLNNKRTHMIQQLYLCVYLRELKTYVHPKTCTHVYSIFIHHCQNVEETKMSFSRQMDSQIAIHSDNGIFISTKKKWPIKSWRQWRNLNVYY